MFVFDTCSQDEYENISNLVYSIGIFVNDDLLLEIEKCRSVISNNGVLYRLKNQKAIESAKARLEDLSKKLMVEVGPIGQNEELDAFTSSIVPIATNYKKQIFDVPEGDNKFISQLKIINEYCYQVYSVAGIDMSDDDVEFFYPVKVLQYFANRPDLDFLFRKYRSYILSMS